MIEPIYSLKMELDIGRQVITKHVQLQANQLDAQLDKWMSAAADRIFADDGPFAAQVQQVIEQELLKEIRYAFQRHEIGQSIRERVASKLESRLNEMIDKVLSDYSRENK